MLRGSGIVQSGRQPKAMRRLSHKIGRRINARLNQVKIALCEYFAYQLQELLVRCGVKLPPPKSFKLLLNAGRTRGRGASRGGIFAGIEKTERCYSS